MDDEKGKIWNYELFGWDNLEDERDIIAINKTDYETINPYTLTVWDWSGNSVTFNRENVEIIPIDLPEYKVIIAIHRTDETEALCKSINFLERVELVRGIWEYKCQNLPESYDYLTENIGHEYIMNFFHGPIVERDPDFDGTIH